MRIQIKSEGRNISLLLPTKLVFGKATVYLANTIGRKYAGEHMNSIQPHALEALFAEFRRIKDHYGTWELVDIESSGGEIIKIIL